LLRGLLDAIRKALPDAGDRKPGDVLQHVLGAPNEPEAKLIEPPYRD
jgi:hypothetical protein